MNAAHVTKHLLVDNDIDDVDPLVTELIFGGEDNYKRVTDEVGASHDRRKAYIKKGGSPDASNMLSPSDAGPRRRDVRT